MSDTCAHYLSIALDAAPGEAVKMTAEQQKKHDTHIFMQREALMPQRIERVSTTAYHDQSPYVPGATLRLRDVDELAEQGSLTSKEVERVKEWRCKFVISTTILVLIIIFVQLSVPLQAKPPR